MSWIFFPLAIQIILILNFTLCVTLIVRFELVSNAQTERNKGKEPHHTHQDKPEAIISIFEEKILKKKIHPLE